MAGQTEQQRGYVAGKIGSQPSAQPQTPPRNPSASSSSKSLMIGFAGVLLTAAAISGFVMTQSASPPPAAPLISAMTSTVTAPVAQTPIYTAPTFAAPTTAPAIATPAAPPAFAGPVAAPLNIPDQCQVGQTRTLSLKIYATLKGEAGNVVRIHSGSYVSPPILVTDAGQIVTVPVSPGASSVTIVAEQRHGGATIDAVDGAETISVTRIDDRNDAFAYRLPEPRC
jgi:hypothetical protein